MVDTVDYVTFQVQIVVRPMSEAQGGTDVTITALSAGEVPVQVVTPSPDTRHGGREGARTPRPGARGTPQRAALTLPLMNDAATHRQSTLMPGALLIHYSVYNLISVLPQQYLVPELSHMGFNIAAELRYTRFCRGSTDIAYHI
jgi:hypothetical protein